jgi:hypothetical protein
MSLRHLEERLHRFAHINTQAARLGMAKWQVRVLAGRMLVEMDTERGLIHMVKLRRGVTRAQARAAITVMSPPKPSVLQQTVEELMLHQVHRKAIFPMLLKPTEGLAKVQFTWSL